MTLRRAAIIATLMDDRRKRALYRATHRGFREADIVIGRFAAAHLAAMGDGELAEFEKLLEANDHLLYGWVLSREAPPAEFEGPVLEKMRDFALNASKSV